MVAGIFERNSAALEFALRPELGRNFLPRARLEFEDMEIYIWKFANARTREEFSSDTTDFRAGATLRYVTRQR